MVVTSNATDDDGRDAAIAADQSIDSEATDKDPDKGDSVQQQQATPSLSLQATTTKPRTAPATNRLLGKSSAAALNKNSRSPLSALNKSSPTALKNTNVRRVGLKKKSVASDSQRSQVSQAPSLETPPLSTSPQSENDLIPIEIDDDADIIVEEEEECGVEAGSKRKLTSSVWKEFKRVKINGIVRAKCMYCFKHLSATTSNGTKHLHVHLKGCVQQHQMR